MVVCKFVCCIGKRILADIIMTEEHKVETFTPEQLLEYRSQRAVAIQTMKHDSEEGKGLQAFMLKLDTIRIGKEDALRQIKPQMDHADAALQNRAKAVAQSLRMGIKEATQLATYIKLSSQIGFEEAGRIVEPVYDYEGLTEEQMKLLKEVQKNITSKMKVSQEAQHKQTPYAASGEGGGRPYGPGNRGTQSCNNCGVVGHWARDNRCRPADVQAKALKDAQAKLQLQAMPSLQTGAVFMPQVSNITQAGTTGW